ncbi:MAG: TVP38/TMEM64 family protein [Desulfomonile tiedjei]|nr:TVP38/TMEM64 family protein [Desulfomonile tiedjei]
MKPVSRQDKIRLAIAVFLLAAILAALAALAATEYWQHLEEMIASAFKNRGEMRAYLKSWGARAPLAFIMIQALQVIVAPIPGELTGAVGGFLFGTGWNILYSSVGLTLGSIIAFMASRLIGLPLVKLVVRQETLEKFHFLTKPRGEVATLILFMIPGFPKDILSYLLGLSPMRFLTFVWVCALGRIPGTAMLSLGGAAFYKENWIVLSAVALVCLIAFIVVYLKKERIWNWIQEHKPHAEN